MPPKKPKLSEITSAIELLEYWSPFGNCEGEIRVSLSAVLKRFVKLSLETKNNPKCTIFSRNCNIVSCFTMKNT